MRCLALAQAWRHLVGGDVVFICAELTDGVEARIRAEGFSIARLPKGAGTSVPESGLGRPGWVVLDGYHFGIEVQHSWSAHGARLLVIDDFAASPRYEANLLLNQNLFATTQAYEGRLSDHVACLIGPEFALLRQELAAAIVPDRPHSGELDHLLLVLGGADVAHQTRRLTTVLASETAPGKRVSVIAGPGTVGLEALKTGGEAGRKEVRLLYDPPDLPALFASADLAISCSGIALLELAAMGTPVLALAATPHEQRAAAAAEAVGFARDLGDVADLTAEALVGELRHLAAAPDALCAMSGAGQAQVDGQGVGRVVRSMIGQ